jgi:hypothetical protein
MSDDEYDPATALRAIEGIRAIAAKHASTPEEAEEATWLAVRKIADPTFEVESPQPNHPNVDKLRAAFHRWDKLPHSREKMNYQAALRSMLQRYGAKP